MFKRIVAGYADDRAGRDAAVLACRLASVCGAEVTFVFPYHPLFAEVSGDVAEQRVGAELGALLGSDPALAQAKFHWSNASWPIRALQELAGFEDADLIVFGGAPERLGRRRINLVERMVHCAPCAIAVAPDRYAEGAPLAIRRIGVGFADTDEGDAAATAAMELARTSGQPLEIIAGSGLSGALAGYAALSAALPDVEDDIYEETRAAVQRLVARLSPNGPVRTEVRRGDPSRVLVDATRGLDLLVLGSRGYGPVRHALLGSVSAHVARHAHCPVLVLPRGVTDAGAGDAQEGRTRRPSLSVAGAGDAQ